MASAMAREIAWGGGESEADRLAVVALDQTTEPLPTLVLWLASSLDPNTDAPPRALAATDAASGELG